MLTSSLKISISKFAGFILFYFRLLSQGSSHPDNLGKPSFFYGNLPLTIEPQTPIVEVMLGRAHHTCPLFSLLHTPYCHKQGHIISINSIQFSWFFPRSKANYDLNYSEPRHFDPIINQKVHLSLSTSLLREFATYMLEIILFSLLKTRRKRNSPGKKIKHNNNKANLKNFKTVKNSENNRIFHHMCSSLLLDCVKTEKLHYDSWIHVWKHIISLS